MNIISGKSETAERAEMEFSYLIFQKRAEIKTKIFNSRDCLPRLGHSVCVCPHQLWHLEYLQQRDARNVSCL